MSENEDDDDLEIVDNLPNSIVDVDDLRFALRNNEKRLKELFPHASDGSSSVVNRLDEQEVFVASAIINREKLQPSFIKPITTPLISNSLVGQKRKERDQLSAASPNSSSVFSIPRKMNSPLSLSSSGNEQALRRRSEGTRAPMLLQSSTTTRWKGQENMKFIGNSLIDMNILISNSSKINHPAPSSTTSSNSSKEKELIAKMNQKKKEKEAETALFSQIDKLLNRKSSHEEEANAEWHGQFNKRLISLEKQEFKSNQKTQLSSIRIQAFECRDCNHFITEPYPSLCKEKKHAIHQITAIKRFFYCSSCNRRDYTLTNEKRLATSSSSTSSSSNQQLLFLPPSRNCVSCGKDNWRIVPAVNTNDKKGSTADGGGKENSQSSSSSMHSLLGERLVTSASEWTSRVDRLNMATRVSNLDK
jgi:hypothetical protein